jgi:hypothetical protein
MHLQIRHIDGRLETVTHFAGRLRRNDGSVLDSVRASLPPGADLLEPGEHRPATSNHQPDPLA